MAGNQGNRRATYQDLLAVPDNLVAEIVDGQLVVTPRPAPRHTFVTSALGVQLGQLSSHGRQRPSGWLILDEPEIHLADEVVVPDLAGWRLERMPAIPAEAYFSIAPDWACEVLSPGTERLDRQKKLPLYAREGVGHVWLVAPDARTVEVLRLESGRWLVETVAHDDDRALLQPFVDIQVELRALWAW